MFMSVQQDGAVLLECRSLSKSFGAVVALHELDFTLREGEVRALLGKNGAGKSTLVNLISGSLQPDGGEILLSGEKVHWSGPKDAKSGGIVVVHQEFSLVPGLTVAENITLGAWPRRAGVFVDQKKLQSRASQALKLLGAKIPLSALVGTLTLAQQQIVEIAKALVDRPKVLILDEPTSALNNAEVDSLLAVVRGLAKSGVSIIYVSHRMKEIPLVADTLTVLRDGQEVATRDVSTTSPQEVAELISGELATERLGEPRDRRAEPEVLGVTDITIPHKLNGVTFSLHRGEVLGIAGLLGSGRTELLEAIFGLRTDARGTVRVNGKAVRRRSPRALLRLRVAMTSEDRKGSGIVPLLSVGENLLLTARGRVLSKFWIRAATEAKVVLSEFAALNIRASGPAQEIGTLSGGNQQKGVIGRTLAAKMRVLLLDEPTRGIDLHAKAQIYQLIRNLADEGVSSIFISSELEELAEVCDRILILRDGRICEELLGADATVERVLSLSMQQEHSNV
jgi:ABC-type sugar transport system ATPase subunit